MSNWLFTPGHSWQRLPSGLQLVGIGGLLGSAFIQPYFAPLLFVGLFLLWQQLVSASSFTAALWRGWVVWYVKSLCALSWFFSAYPLDSVEAALSPGGQLLAIGMYLATCALWLSAGGIILGGGVWVIHNKVGHMLTRSLLITGWLVLCEVIGAGVFSLATTAAGIPLGSAFAFGFVGVPSAVLPGVIGWSLWGGVYMLSALIGFYTVSLMYQTALRRWYWLGSGLVCLVGGGLLFNQLGSYTSQTPLTVAVIETNFSAALLSSPAGSQEKATALQAAFQSALAAKPDHILFPEGAGFIDSLYPGVAPAVAYNYYRFDFNTPTSVVQDSLRLETAAGTVLRSVTFDGKNNVVSQVDKQYLVPQGEYVPALYGTFLNRLGFSDVLTSMQQNQSYRPGPLTVPTVQNSQIPPVLFCFSSSDPLGVRQLAGAHTAPFVAHPVSHAWFHSPTALWYQLDQFLRIQATWNQVPIVSAANLAPSRVYWPGGAVTQGSVVASGALWRVRLVTLP